MSNKTINIRGFTLLEMLVSMALSAILALIAIPNMGSLNDSINKRNSELQLLQDLRRAQALTVKQGCRGIFTFSSDQRSYAFGCDYLPYNTAAVPTADSNLLSKVLPLRITISADQLIIFNSRGQVVDTDDFLATRVVTLKIDNVAFNTGIVRPTGFFGYSS